MSIVNVLVGLTASQYIWIVTMSTLIFMMWRIQKSNRLDLADMLTKNGRSVSLTKVLQLVGGITATWVIVTLTMNSHLTESIFGLYLTYIGGVEAYSKFVAAKYQYDEKSIRDQTQPEKTAPPAEDGAPTP